MSKARFIAFCPKCHFPLVKINNKWKCPNCGREEFQPLGYTIKEGK